MHSRLQEFHNPKFAYRYPEDIIKEEQMRTNRFGENGEAETQILDCPLESEAIFV